MKPVCLFILICFLSLQPLHSQTLPLRELPKPARKTLSGFIFIPGGTFVQGVFEGRDSLQFSKPKETEVPTFLISQYETTVAEYVHFASSTGDPADIPDTTVWKNEFGTPFDHPMWRYYFKGHPAFSAFPIICVNWEQANRYCRWKTAEVNALLEDSPFEVEVRLPTESEWEYAALGGALVREIQGESFNSRLFPWDGNFMDANKSCGYKAHCNSGPIETPDYPLFAHPYDGGLFTVRVGAYEANGFGLFQMAGNAAEWTADEINTAPDLRPRPGNTGEANPAVLPRPYAGYKIVKGGSWNDSPFYMQCGARRLQPANQGSFTIGFRPVCVIRKKG